MSAQLVPHVPRATILVVEDDPAVAKVENDILASSGYHVETARNGAQARSLVTALQPDLILLDLGLPDIDGLVLLTNFRARLTCAIIVVSASHGRWDTVLGLKLGADDYVTKPFDADDLDARVEAVLRRRRHTPAPLTAPPSEEHRLGSLVLHPVQRQATVDSRSLKLTPAEYALLVALAEQPDNVVSRDDLAKRVWGRVDGAENRTVDVYIRRIRGKLAQFNGTNVPLVVAARGMGYRLIPPDRRVRAA